jgi:hypothetical protein
MWRSLSFLVVWWGVGPALAGPAAIGVIPVDAPEHEAEGGRIQAAIQQAIEQNPGWQAKASAMRLDEARLTFSCFDESEACMAQVGALLQVDLLLWGTLEAHGGARALKLQLLDVKHATTVRRERYERSGPAAVEQLAEAARGFVRGHPVESLAHLEVRSEPSGAAVQIDGQPFGATPAVADLPPGSHRVQIQLAGHHAVEREVALTGEGAVLDEQLTPLMATPVVRTRAPATTGGSDTGFWLGIGAGGVAVVSAGIATAFGLRTLDLRDDAAKADTEAGHAHAVSEGKDKRLLTNVAWGVAAAAAATSAYFFFFYDDAPSSGHVGMGVGPGGVAVGGSF